MSKVFRVSWDEHHYVYVEAEDEEEAEKAMSNFHAMDTETGECHSAEVNEMSAGDVVHQQIKLSEHVNEYIERQMRKCLEELFDDDLRGMSFTTLKERFPLLAKEFHTTQGE